jgi:hypothetical protein
MSSEDLRYAPLLELYSDLIGKVFPNLKVLCGVGTFRCLDHHSFLFSRFSEPDLHLSVQEKLPGSLNQCFRPDKFTKHG